MNASLRDGFVGGLIGSVAVLLALSLLVLIGQVPRAPFVGAYQAVLGGGWAAAAIVGGALFLFFGALWAVPFALLIPGPTIPKGILWGLLPTLWMWTFVPAVLTGGALGLRTLRPPLRHLTRVIVPVRAWPAASRR